MDEPRTPDAKQARLKAAVAELRPILASAVAPHVDQFLEQIVLMFESATEATAKSCDDIAAAFRGQENTEAARGAALCAEVIRATSVLAPEPSFDATSRVAEVSDG